MKDIIKEALDTLKKESSERKFTQSVDVVVTLRDLDLTDSNQQVEFFARLPHGIGRKQTVVALVGPELEEEAKEVVDLVITKDKFSDYKDKAKDLAKEYDFFIAQSDVMPQVATTFGRYLGPRGKMPNPKLGSVLTAKSKVKPVYERLQNQVKIKAKNNPMIQAKVGDQSMKDEELIENITQIYNQIITNLPREKSNLKEFKIKYTMSKPVTVNV